MLQVCSATPNDAAVLARFRVMLFKEMGRLEGDAAEFAQSSEGYFSWALSTGREVAWVAEDMGEPVAVLAMTLEPMPPKPGRPRLVEAYMHNVYVLPDRRMRGLAKRLVTAAPEYANKKGVRRVRLFTSDDVRRMYENLGFEPHGRYLEIKL
ncbi:GNAT family N-acetyltransferase [Oceanithermus sp.]